MVFRLIWCEEDIEDISNNIHPKVAEDLEKALEDKKRQVSWCKGMVDLRKRFHRIFNLENLTVAEIRFSSMSGEYRAICVVITDEESVVYYETVPKKGSHQERLLNIMRGQSEKIEESIRRNVL